jgi:3-deoxy-D-manno-octulosonic-acid transferase
MVHTARVKGVPVAVVGGMVHQGSARLPWLARTIMKGLYRDLAFVGAVSHEDALRWIQLGTSRHAVKVTGDPRSDYVLERSPNHQVLQPFEAWASAGPVMVAGSTDRRDEEVLIDACAKVRSNHRTARLMVVPHEPSREGTERLRDQARSLGLEVAIWSRSTANHAPAPAPAVVVVDAVGILADLYALGTLAYVGGGFGTAGIHSLLEPASFGIPVLAGPGAMDDAAARAFVESGGVVVIEGAMPAETLAARWTALLGDADLRTSAGRAARAQITRGAAEESMKGLERLLADVNSREERARV